jgi:acid phosphatase type 7
MSFAHFTASAAALLATLLLGGCGGGGGGSSGGGTAPEVTFTIAAAGDIADCDGDEPVATSTYARTAALVTPMDTFVLTLGDTTYPIGAPVEFSTCFVPTWGAFKDRIRPAPGNHEYYTPNADGYFNYFGPLAGPDRRGYYSFDFGGWHFISLNSNIDASPPSAQYQWLLADLAGSQAATCTIAYWHYPVFSSGMHGNIAQMTKVYEALQASGVDIVLSGHDHSYERFAPQNADGVADPARGIREFVVGTGGSENYVMEATRPNSEVRNNTTHGILRLTLGQGRYSWQYLPIGGAAFTDSGSDTCHR